ncbi:unnamed protein product, partial [Cylicocyclus nassatus]
FLDVWTFLTCGTSDLGSSDFWTSGISDLLGIRKLIWIPSSVTCYYAGNIYGSDYLIFYRIPANLMWSRLLDPLR